MEENKEKLPGNYIAGFVEGEGCFALTFRKDVQHNIGNNKPREYYYWGVQFAIVLRSDDVHILKLIKEELDCGSITFTGKGEQARYSVQNAKDLSEKIIPFFKKYKLRAKKAADFNLWAQAVDMLDRHRNGILNAKTGMRGFTKKEIPPENQEKLKKIRNQMLGYKTKRSKNFKWGNQEKQ